MPRSGWATTRVRISSATGMSGISAWRQRRGAGRWRTSTCAPHSASATFVISEGCSDTPATRNHDREPLTCAPRPGTSTSTSSTRQPASSHGLAARHRRGGTRRPTQNSTAPTSANANWRKNTPYDEPPAA